MQSPLIICLVFVFIICILIEFDHLQLHIYSSTHICWNVALPVNILILNFHHLPCSMFNFVQLLLWYDSYMLLHEHCYCCMSIATAATTTALTAVAADALGSEVRLPILVTPDGPGASPTPLIPAPLLLLLF